jgi:hypothetical protein
MSIPFVCDRCGHAIDVDDRMAGLHGTCKHCGHRLVVPSAHRGPRAAPGEAPLRLRPLEGDEPPRVADHLLAHPAPLAIRPAEAEPRRRPQAVSDPDPGPAAAPARPSPRDDYNVLDPYHLSRTRSSLGPPPVWWLLPVMTARFISHRLRGLRDRLYVVSLFFLVLVLIGYLFQLKLLLHLGAVGVIAANISMLATGLAYLVTLPFKESLRHGLANLLIPFYAIYYWTTRWPRMRTPVYRTLGAFLPIALVGLAYLVYEEGPAVEQAIEKEVPALEKAIDDRVPALERKVDDLLQPLEKAAPPSSSRPDR